MQKKIISFTNFTDINQDNIALFLGQHQDKGIIFLNLHGEIISTNYTISEVLGFTGDELHETNIFDYFTERIDRKLFNVQNNTSYNGRYLEYRLRIRHKTEGNISVSIMIYPYVLTNGLTSSKALVVTRVY